MTVLVTIAFFMAVTGCFIMLELSPFTFLSGLAGYLKPESNRGASGRAGRKRNRKG